MVSKDELFRTLWQDTVVSDGALTACVQELRRVLRDEFGRFSRTPTDTSFPRKQESSLLSIHISIRKLIAVRRR
jgi:DNA-binding winged helix-turn-helix (wHTH) protein